MNTKSTRSSPPAWLLLSVALGAACAAEPPAPESCAVGLTVCGDGACVDTAEDPDHCGGCDVRCDDTAVCASGRCQPACPADHVICGAQCAHPWHSRTHCGARGDCVGPNGGEACGPAERCEMGACEIACPDPQVLCGGACVDPMTDYYHCGASGDCRYERGGVRCGAGEHCDGGVCIPGCSVPQILCGNICTDPGSDRDYCGAFGSCEGAESGVVCAGGELCVNGVCERSCGVGEVVCAGSCIDPAVNQTFCGAGSDCTGANAGQMCASGEICSDSDCVPNCFAGELLCAGACTDPQRSEGFCGASGDCQGPNAGTACAAGEVCTDGVCALVCPPGLVDCGGRCVDSTRDPEFCGATTGCTGVSAGVACAPDQICSGGVCVLNCGSNRVPCGGGCIDPLTDRNYCGASGNCQGLLAGAVCPPGHRCDGTGVCAASCGPGQIDCSGDCIDPLVDPDHCGASGDCAGANAGAMCGSQAVCDGTGSCGLNCTPPWIGCGGACIDPARDDAYCGASADCQGANAGIACAATETCAGSACIALAPVTAVSATAPPGLQVIVTWTPSVTPGYGRTRILKKLGSYPTGPTDGVVVADAGDGISVAVDTGVAVWERWYYAAFATNLSVDDFATAVPAGTNGTFIAGEKTCPPGEVLRGVAGDLSLQCSPPGLNLRLDCTFASQRASALVFTRCPAGFNKTGGGFTGIDQAAGGDAFDNFTSRPWSGEEWETGFNDETDTFIGWVRCCRVRSTESYTGPSTCGAGEAAVGVVGATGPGAGLTCGRLLREYTPLSCNNGVTCTNGDITGGGFADIDQNGFGDSSDNFASRPHATAGWEVVFNDDVDSYFFYRMCCGSTTALATQSAPGACPAGQVAVGIDAIDGSASLVCAAGTTSSSLSCSSTQATTPVGQVTTSAACPAGTTVTGGGFSDIDQNGGGSSLDNFDSFMSVGNRWRVSFSDDTDTFTAHARCCAVNGSLTVP